jgi:hypothetical protein
MPANVTPSLSTASGDPLHFTGKRTVRYRLVGGLTISIQYWVCPVKTPLVSVRSLTAGGLEISFGKDSGKLTKTETNQTVELVSTGLLWFLPVDRRLKPDEPMTQTVSNQTESNQTTLNQTQTKLLYYDRYDRNAFAFRTTKDDGPAWNLVLRRITYDITHTPHTLIADEDVTTMTDQQLHRPLPYGINIKTTLFYKPLTTTTTSTSTVNSYSTRPLQKLHCSTH